MLYSSKSTFLTFSSQIPTNSVNLTKFLPFLYMRNIEYLWGILSSHENYHIPIMRNGKTTEILSSLLWDSHKILWGIFVRAASENFKTNEIETSSGFRAQPHMRQAGGFLATATPFHTWRYQLITRYIFIKNVIAVAAYRSCGLRRWEKMSWIYDLCNHHWTQSWHPISDTGHVS